MFASFEWQFRQIISEHAIKVNEEFSKDQIPRMSLYVKQFYTDFKKKKKKKNGCSKLEIKIGLTS